MVLTTGASEAEVSRAVEGGVMVWKGGRPGSWFMWEGQS